MINYKFVMLAQTNTQLDHHMLPRRLQLPACAGMTQSVALA
jgi:hypothetical protein